MTKNIAIVDAIPEQVVVLREMDGGSPNWRYNVTFGMTDGTEIIYRKTVTGDMPSGAQTTLTNLLNTLTTNFKTAEGI